MNGVINRSIGRDRCRMEWVTDRQNGHFGDSKKGLGIFPGPFFMCGRFSASSVVLMF